MRRHKTKHPFIGAMAGVCTVMVPFLAFLVYQGRLDISWLSGSSATARRETPKVELSPDEKIRQFISTLPEVQAYATREYRRSGGKVRIVTQIVSTPQDGWWRVRVGEDRGAYVQEWKTFYVNAQTGGTCVQDPVGSNMSLKNWRMLPSQQQLRDYYQKAILGR